MFDAELDLSRDSCKKLTHNSKPKMIPIKQLQKITDIDLFFTFIPHINKNHVQWEKFLNVAIQKTTIISFHILSLNYLIFLCTEYFPKRFLATDLISIQLVPCKKTRYHSQHMLSFFFILSAIFGFFFPILFQWLLKNKYFISYI